MYFSYCILRFKFCRSFFQRKKIKFVERQCHFKVMFYTYLNVFFASHTMQQVSMKRKSINDLENAEKKDIFTS